MRAALRQDRPRTLVGGAVSLLLLFVSFDRMVRLYETHGDRPPVAGEG
jgi:hypothetical protein